MLNSAAAAAVGLGTGPTHGIELAADGRPTGRLYGLDGCVTGVTDATPTERAEDVVLLADAVAGGALPREVVVMGGPGLDPKAGAELARGPVKLVVADHRLPALDRLAAAIDSAHRSGRAVAIHCVTRVGLLLALAAWDDAGPRDGDRIEHGAVVHPDGWRPADGTRPTWRSFWTPVGTK